MESVKKSNADSSINNTNNIILNVNQEKPKRKYTKKKQNPNWYTKAIIGGIITIIVTLVIYYATGDTEKHTPPGVDNNSNAISGIKQ